MPPEEQKQPHVPKFFLDKEIIEWLRHSLQVNIASYNTDHHTSIYLPGVCKYITLTKRVQYTSITIDGHEIYRHVDDGALDVQSKTDLLYNIDTIIKQDTVTRNELAELRAENYKLKLQIENILEELNKLKP